MEGDKNKYTLEDIRKLILDKSKRDFIIDNAILDFLSFKKNCDEKSIEKIMVWLRDYRDVLFMTYMERAEHA